MNVPAIGQKRLVIVGGTGMVGGYALRYALDHSAIGSVTAIGRKKLGTSNAKLKEVLHRDFADCSALAEALSGQDAAVFCLGAYTGAVPDAEFRTITVDYPVEFARVLRTPQMIQSQTKKGLKEAPIVLGAAPVLGFGGTAALAGAGEAGAASPEVVNTIRAMSKAHPLAAQLVKRALEGAAFAGGGGAVIKHTKWLWDLLP